MLIIRTVLFIMLLLVASSPSFAFWSSEPASLKELASGVAMELKDTSGGQKNFIWTRPMSRIR